jgi:carbon storage regulator
LAATQVKHEVLSMLVISRKTNDSLVINGDIRVTVVEIRGDRVRLGIEAPSGMSVHRGEVAQALAGWASRGDAERRPPVVHG